MHAEFLLFDVLFSISPLLSFLLVFLSPEEVTSFRRHSLWLSIILTLSVPWVLLFCFHEHAVILVLSFIISFTLLFFILRKINFPSLIFSSILLSFFVRVSFLLHSDSFSLFVMLFLVVFFWHSITSFYNDFSDDELPKNVALRLFSIALSCSVVMFLFSLLFCSSAKMF